MRNFRLRAVRLACLAGVGACAAAAISSNVPAIAPYLTSVAAWSAPSDVQPVRVGHRKNRTQREREREELAVILEDAR